MIEGGAALHILRYDYDEEQDRVPALPSLSIEIRLPEPMRATTVVAPSGDVPVDLRRDGDRHTIELRDVPLYSVVVIERVRSEA